MKQQPKRIRAEKYFAAHGINPNKPNSDGINNILDMRPSTFWKKGMDSVLDYPCSISIEGFLFYAYVEVGFDIKGQSYTFQGGSGGIGLGDLTCEGVIYFGNGLETLLAATTFGVAFGAEDGGVCQVTWGTSGNATAAGIGEGLGAFGGSGSWHKTKP